jgi:hypothetical protein
MTTGVSLQHPMPRQRRRGCARAGMPARRSTRWCRGRLRRPRSSAPTWLAPSSGLASASPRVRSRRWPRAARPRWRSGGSSSGWSRRHRMHRITVPYYDYHPRTRPHRGGTPIAGPTCLSAGPRRQDTSNSRAGAHPGTSRIVAGALGTVAGEEAVTDALSVGPGATRPESGHGRRTSRTAPPRTTGAAAQRPAATRTARGPHTPDRGASAHHCPARA